VISDTDPPPEAPIHEQRLDETEVGHAKVVTFMEITPERSTIWATKADLLPSHLGLDHHSGAVVEHDVFVSIYNSGKIALLVGWKDVKAAKAWSPKKIDGIQALRQRSIRIVREYGRFDRREAPQFYPDVKDTRRTKQATLERS
jgi:hypothetical protein